MGRKNSKRKPFKDPNKKPGGTRNLRHEILDVFAAAGDQVLNYKQVSAKLGLTDGPVRAMISEILAAEVAKGTLLLTDQHKYRLKHIPNQVLEGRIQINQHGRGFVQVPGYDEEFVIRPGDTGFAFWGDTVEIKAVPSKKRPSAKVVRIVKRALESYVGILQTNDGGIFVTPTNRRINKDFYIPKEHKGEARNGQKVLVTIHDWRHPSDTPEGRIIKVLGFPGDNDVEMNAILAEFGLDVEFAPELEEEAAAIPSKITKEDYAKRRDMREVTTFTIDPHDAKDFDDALSIQRLDNGNWEIGVHIADVSHYLQPGTALNEEAYARATSVYLVDRTIPMLPEVLSNGLCSLRPNEEKLTFSAVFEMDEEGQIKGEWFGRTVTLSDRRFTYAEAQSRIESGEGDQADMIQVMDRLAKKMRARRFKSRRYRFPFRRSEVSPRRQGQTDGCLHQEIDGCQPFG